MGSRTRRCSRRRLPPLASTPGTMPPSSSGRSACGRRPTGSKGRGPRARAPTTARSAPGWRSLRGFWSCATVSRRPWGRGGAPSTARSGASTRRWRSPTAKPDTLAVFVPLLLSRGQGAVGIPGELARLGPRPRVQEQEADAGHEEEQEQTAAAPAPGANLLAPYPLAALARGPGGGLDLAAEPVVVPEPGDDLRGVLAGELVRYGTGRLDKGADVVSEVVVIQQALEHRPCPGVGRAQRRHRDERVRLGLLS